MPPVVLIWYDRSALFWFGGRKSVSVVELSTRFQVGGRVMVMVC
jgi:hypothetical protein